METHIAINIQESKGVGYVWNLLGTYWEEAGDNLDVIIFKTNQPLKQWVTRPWSYSENAIVRM